MVAVPSGRATGAPDYPQVGSWNGSGVPAGPYHGRSMTQLSQKSRDSLPDSAFAYVDSRGRRRLPINDEAHVRNALARFNQTTFEDEAARDRSRTRLLKAAKKYGIVPV